MRSLELKVFFAAVTAFAFFVTPGAVLGIAFVVVLWALWRRRPRGRGVRR